ncbi:hypothetical protein GCM10008942_29430 [Rhizomicrobium electricum]|uniref:Uncharacterized protein n=1 Tax=Rhizomicrobium electricum TaxID=480070 RepID=A0ABN1EZT2_9PROT|nr:hypothetical protein [Rhizomicrobium electricum]
MRVLMARELNGGGRQRKGFSAPAGTKSLEVDPVEQIQHALPYVGRGRHDHRGDAGCHHGVFDRRGAVRVAPEAG